MSIAFAKLAYEFTPHQVMVSIQKLFPDACIQADPEGMWGMLNIDGCLFNAKSPQDAIYGAGEWLISKGYSL